MGNSARFAILGLVVLSGGMVPIRAEAQVLAKTLLFNTVQPCRVADTRSAVAGIMLSGIPRTFDVVGATTNYTSQGGIAAQEFQPPHEGARRGEIQRRETRAVHEGEVECIDARLAHHRDQPAKGGFAVPGLSGRARTFRD